MPGKVEFYSEMAERVSSRLTGSLETRTGFLETSVQLNLLRSCNAPPSAENAHAKQTSLHFSNSESHRETYFSAGAPLSQVIPSDVDRP